MCYNRPSAALTSELQNVNKSRSAKKFKHWYFSTRLWRTQSTMKCHYEILGVASNATSDEIKKSYRKLALEWHPDKNLHREEEAKETFQLLQQAYEVLIDPQERAWYDRHREEILRGGFDDNYKDDSLDVYQYFNSSCFKGYGDDERGFYSVYREVFNKISSEDEPFIEEKTIDVPMFGLSDSSYEEVVHPFYAYWQSYCTAKSFSWVDKYDLSEFRKANVGRQVLRAMEKENKKLRDQHKKLRNEEVRQLVAFVRKRDKRIQAHRKWLEEQSAQKAKKFQEQRNKQMEERKKDLLSYKEAEWSSLSQFEQHFNELEARLDDTFGAEPSNENDEDTSEQEFSDLYCVACDKDFRSEKAMKNHENSKKHKENVLLLRQTMEEEELKILNLVGSEAEEEGEIVNVESEHCNGGSSSPSYNGSIDQLSFGSDEDDLNQQVHTSSKTKKKKKRKKNVPNMVGEFDEPKREESVLPNITKDIDSLTLQSEENSVDDHNPQQNLDDKQVSDDITRKSVHYDNNREPSSVENHIQESDVKEETAKTQTDKAKDAKKKKHKTNNVQNTDAETSQKASTLCEKCNRNFGSRNKLFDHLKESGHAIYLGEPQPSTRTSKTNNNTKKKKGKR